MTLYSDPVRAAACKVLLELSVLGFQMSPQICMDGKGLVCHNTQHILMGQAV